MPGHLKALVVILILASAVFAFAKGPACALASTTADFERRRNLWFGITLVAFLAHSFWIFIIVTVVLLRYTAAREPNKLAMFFFLLFVVPPFAARITGLGIVDHLFTIDYIRLLTLAILLPAYLSLRKQSDTERFGQPVPDKIIVGYLILIVLLQLTHDTVTNSLRHGVFYSFVDVFLPYYVASRSLKNLQGFRDVLMGFAVGALVLSAIGGFEIARHWLLYANLDDALGVYWGYGKYQEREGGGLRAQGSTGHPIVLGYVIAVAAGFFFYLRKSVPSPMAWSLGLLLLLAGLIAPLSRGPWVGAAAMLIVFIITGPSPAKNLAKFGLLGLIVLPALLLSPAGEKIIAHLPFIGTVEAVNVTYRQRLLDASIQVIAENPFFGASDFMNAPEMQELMGGQGIVDIVNSYLAVGLASGLVGLSLFAGVFIAVVIGVFKGMSNLVDKNDERHLLGRVLLSVLAGVMVIIFTVSSISVIPVIYWSLAGFGVAYARMLELAKAPESAQNLNSIQVR